jgi:glycosyltransferase involved in cell wall biosynthesis
LILENEFVLGGLEKKLYDFVSRIDTNHFRIVICCLKEGGYLKDAFLRLGTPFYEGIQHHKYDVSAIGRLFRILDSERIDLLYTTPHPNTLVFAHLARRMRRVRRTVVSIHASTNPEGGPLFPAYQKLFLGNVDRFIAVADMHKRLLVDKEGLDERKITVVHNGVDLQSFRPGPRDETLVKNLGIQPGNSVITTVASLKALKGIDVLLYAASGVLKRHGAARFILVGDSKEGDRYVRMAEELGIADRVTFTGQREDVADILRASDIFVLPSRTEAFPNVVLEAMATALPVVATDVGSVRELVEEGANGHVVPSENAAALERALCELLDDLPAARRLGARGREIVEESFALDTMIAARVRLLEEVLRQPRSS